MIDSGSCVNRSENQKFTLVQFIWKYSNFKKPLEKKFYFKNFIRQFID